MSISEDKQDNRLFLYAIGLALGIVLGFALGCWATYSQSLKYADKAVDDFIAQAPVECRIALTYSNPPLMPLIHNWTGDNYSSEMGMINTSWQKQIQLHQQN